MPNRSDNFTGTDNSPLNGRTPSDGGSAWVANGTYKIQTNRAGFASGWSDASLDCGANNYEVSLQIQPGGSSTGNVEFFILARNIGATAIALKWNGQGTLSIEEWGGGGTKTTASQWVSPTDFIKLSVNGSSVRAYVNGVEVTALAYTTTLLTGGYAGFASGSDFSVDDFSITELSTDSSQAMSGSASTSGHGTASPVFSIGI